MKKSLIALGLSAVMVAATAVPALADDASLNIYGIYKAGDQTWFIDEGDAAKVFIHRIYSLEAGQTRIIENRAKRQESVVI